MFRCDCPGDCKHIADCISRFHSNVAELTQDCRGNWHRIVVELLSHRNCYIHVLRLVLVHGSYCRFTSCYIHMYCYLFVRFGAAAESAGKATCHQRSSCPMRTYANGLAHGPLAPLVHKLLQRKPPYLKSARIAASRRAESWSSSTMQVERCTTTRPKPRPPELVAVLVRSPSTAC
jgi:hypothetical protein